MIPKPSSPGTGIRLSTTASTMKNPSTASAAKKFPDPDVIHPAWIATPKVAAMRRPHTAVPTGPAIETAALHARVRKAEWLM